MRGPAICIVLCCVAGACHHSHGIVSDVVLEPDEPPDPDLDTDGDTISDMDEGRWDASGPVDTDGDSVPDYLDLDSDGDAIPDRTEAGDADTATPPVDTDSDLVPDFQDLDSDGDAIGDRDEGEVDTDGDGVRDSLDLDSDCDTILDRDEAGDGSLATPPDDVDGDGMPSFRDRDSDGDGLADRWEAGRGMDPHSGDTDGDGASDLVEVARRTDPLVAPDHPERENHPVFFMPFNDPADPPPSPLEPDPLVWHLVFMADIQMADVFFALDSSGSMTDEINNLHTSLRSIVVPGVLAEIPDVWFGVGRFEDCTVCPHNMAVLQPVTSDVLAVESSLGGWATDCGQYEPYNQYLYALATGDISPFLGWGGVTPATWSCTPPGSVGWGCFRPDALPIVVLFGDEDFDQGLSMCSPGYDHEPAIDALNSIGAKFIGVNSGIGSRSSFDDMVVLARGTDSVDVSGDPLVFTITPTGGGLGSQVVTAIEILASQVPVEATAVPRDDPGDGVDVLHEFVDHLEASIEGGHPDPLDPSRACVSGLDVADRYPPLDGRPDTFTSVLPGTRVCFDMRARRNRIVAPGGEPQSFLLLVDLVGGGITVLDTVKVFFFVPPLVPSTCE